MSIIKRRKDGRYVKVIVINGKRKSFYSSEPTEKKAERDIQHQLLEYRDKLTNGELFGNIADAWNTEYRLSIPDITYRKSIKAAYERIVNHFSDEFIKDITSREIDIFLRSLKYGQKTVLNHKCILNMIFDYAILNNHTRDNPVAPVKLPKGLAKSKRELPTSEELNIVSSHYEGFDLLPYFLLFTGCRKSEALAIKGEEIDFINNTIPIRNHVIHDGNRPVYESVLKSDAAYRDIILLDRLKEVLPKNFTGFLFSMNNDGKEPLTKGAFDKRWKAYCKKYQINITAHQLRHGYATMLFEANIDLKDAQDLMGHSDINLTKSIYTHIRDKRKKETADKLNSFSF